MRRHLAYAAAGAVVLALTSCGDDPEPQVADPTSTPSSSSSPSESAAAEKEPWEEKTDDGAVAFVEHWLDVFNEMQTSANTQEFSSIGTDGCRACAEFVSINQEIAADGGTIESKGWKLIDAAVGAASTNAKKEVVAHLDQSPERISYSGAKKPREYPGGEATVLMTLVWQESTWVMDEVAFP